MSPRKPLGPLVQVSDLFHFTSTLGRHGGAAVPTAAAQGEKPYNDAVRGGGQRNEAPSSCRCVHGSLEPLLAVTGDASGLATCSNLFLYCAEHHATCAAQVTLNALRRHQQEGRASGTRVQVEASSVGTRPDRMLGWGRGQREGPRRGLESARRSRSSCGGSARAGGSLCWADDYKRGRWRRWQRLKLVW